jgi:DNA-binding transcriptional LysR family regulator
VDVRFFTTFLEVSKTRHFSKAAENLYLTPAAVSARIKQLEEYFNTSLFTRVRNSIQLTPAGEKLLPYANEMVDKLKQARNALGEQDAEFLAWGATPNAASLILEQVLSACKDTLPNAAITTEIHCSEKLSRQLHERTIDFAFTTEPLKSADIESIELDAYPLYLFKQSVSEGDPSGNNFAHVIWSSKATTSTTGYDASLKHYKLKTNDALVAINYVNQYGGSICLPKALAHKLSHTLGNEPEVANISVYCVRLKERPQPLMDVLVTRLKSPSLA